MENNNQAFIRHIDQCLETATAEQLRLILLIVSKITNGKVDHRTARRFTVC